MTTGQTDKIIHHSSVYVVLAAFLIGLSGLIGLPAGLYYALGKLEPDTLRMVACGSICLAPIMAIASAAYSFALYKANRKGQEIGTDFARDSWHEVAAGLGKVAQQTRQPARPSTALVYPYPTGLPPQAGMIIEQRQAPGTTFYE